MIHFCLSVYRLICSVFCHFAVYIPDISLPNPPLCVHSTHLIGRFYSKERYWAHTIILRYLLIDFISIIHIEFVPIIQNIFFVATLTVIAVATRILLVRKGMNGDMEMEDLNFDRR